MKKRGGYYRTEDDRELKSLFKVLTDYNTFPANRLEQMREIVEKGKIPPMQVPDSRGNLPNLESMMSLLSSLSAAEGPQEAIAYPGKAASFALAEGDWEPFGPRRDLCRILVFKSQTPDSLIKQFKVLGYIQGNIRIYFDFAPRDLRMIEKYFRGQGLQLMFSPEERMEGFFRTGPIHEARDLFKLIAANNTFSEEDRAKIQGILDLGKL